MFLLIAAGCSDTARAGLGGGARCSRAGGLYSGAVIADVEVVEEVVVEGFATVRSRRPDSISKYSDFDYVCPRMGMAVEIMRRV